MQGTLSDADMNALLISEVFGHLGCTDGQKPYVVPMAYVYHNDALYGQTTEGRKVEMLRKNPLVCFQVEKNTGHEWKSVICRGTFQELDFADLKTPLGVKIVELLTRKIGAIQSNVGITVPFTFTGSAAPVSVNDKTSTLFRIVITEKTGRFFVAQS